ncbi:MAG: hypothetical protein ABH952_06775 [Candidatus Omnitrophota bacterium]
MIFSRRYKVYAEIILDRKFLGELLHVEIQASVRLEKGTGNFTWQVNIGFDMDF